nr:DUF3530 family protein [uncultured Amphritea sp.]
MKLKPLFFTLFLSLATTVSAAENDTTENSDSSNLGTEDATTDTGGEIASRVMPDPARQRQADLALAQTPETEVVWLELDDEKQLALLQQATTATPTGSILIFTDPTTGADWPDLIHPLRTQLTEYGWNTLSLSLPTPPSVAIPERTLPSLQNRNQIQTAETASESGAAPNAETNSDAETADDSQTVANSTETTSPEELINTYQQQIVTLGNLAANRLAEVPGEITVILGIGEGAVWAMHYFAQDELQENRFLVLLDPMQTEGINAPELLQMIKDSQAPILDLWFNNNRYQQQQATLRKHTALRSGNPGYRQIRLNQRSNDPRKEPLWLTRQVRGILKNHLITIQPQKNSNPAPAGELTPGS